MKTSGLIILGLCLPVCLAHAQEERRDSLVVPSYEPSRPHFNMASQIRPTGVKISSSAYDRGVAQQKAASGESVSSPALKSAASSDALEEEPRALEDLTLPAGVMPYYYGGWSPYSLHEGMNVSMDLSAMVQSGKHARSGVGFRQRVDATYVMPLSKHWWATAGGIWIMCPGEVTAICLEACMVSWAISLMSIGQLRYMLRSHSITAM